MNFVPFGTMRYSIKKSEDVSVNMANIDDTYSNPSKEYEVATSPDEYESVKRSGQEDLEQLAGVSYMLIFNAPLRATSLDKQGLH